MHKCLVNLVWFFFLKQPLGSADGAGYLVLLHVWDSACEIYALQNNSSTSAAVHRKGGYVLLRAKYIWNTVLSSINYVV